jgi:hypothetical protein
MNVGGVGCLRDCPPQPAAAESGAPSLGQIFTDVGPLFRPPTSYFFDSLNVISGQSSFASEPAETAQNAIRTCCVPLENWAPGQRPLLR